MSYEMLNGGVRNEYSLEIPGNNHVVLNNFYKPNPNSQFYSQRPPMSINEQAEIEFELRFRGNMIFDQQRKIQQLEDELKLAHQQIDMLSSQLQAYEQERSKEKKKPQSRYWTAEEHQRFLEALDKFGHKDVKAISMHVSTRNATQVRTHAQKYFLRLERERVKKEGGLPEGDISSDEDGDEDSHGMSISHITNPISPAASQPPSRSESPEQTTISALDPSPITTRRRRAASLMSHVHRNHTTHPQNLSHSTSNVSTNLLHPSSASTPVVNAPVITALSISTPTPSRMPSTWTMEDYNQFVRGLVQHGEKCQDDEATCRLIQEEFLPQRPVDEIVIYYRSIMKTVNRKSPLSALKQPTVQLLNSPKRRRTYSRPEPLVLPPGANSAPLNLSPLNPNAPPPQPYPYRVLQSIYNQPNSSLQLQLQTTPNPQFPVNSSLRAPFDFSSLSTPTSLSEIPLLSELNINNVPALSPMSLSTPALGLPIDPSLSINTIPVLLNNNQPLPNGMWTSTLPFSFDTLMAMSPQQQHQQGGSSPTPGSGVVTSPEPNLSSVSL